MSKRSIEGIVRQWCRRNEAKIIELTEMPNGDFFLFYRLRGVFVTRRCNTMPYNRFAFVLKKRGMTLEAHRTLVAKTRERIVEALKCPRKYKLPSYSILLCPIESGKRR